ncbi:hypothetical protein JX265_012372 [Neoarthrinium moseri]|uniref:Heterokaryon incompatibility domain-containing protein n=1 Tax=Neoarthrinium moseri TaxID=1658444 RepID=A0A9Q0AJM9_9PEZI|nr:hypothetical protein JX265_012372 [Neoarthrinium moseri]
MDRFPSPTATGPQTTPSTPSDVAVARASQPPEGSTLQPEQEPDSQQDSACAICIRISHTVKAVIPDTKLWSLETLSGLFHEKCQECDDARSSEDELLCVECRHLRLRHLSLHVSSDDWHGPISLHAAQAARRQLCPLCQSLDAARRFELEQQRRGLSNRVSHGDCDGFLLAALPTRADGLIQLSFQSYFKNGHDLVDLEIDLLLNVHDVGSASSLAGIEEPAQGCGGRTLSSPPSALHPSLISCWDLIQAWLVDCSSMHQCQPNLGIPLPVHLRLYDVEQQRVVCAATLGNHVPEYVCLSYVWGKDERHSWNSLKRANMGQFMDDLSPETLPATLQDAVTACRHLNERYLWVDWLCIVQDDADDQDSQIHGMGSIFSRAKLVLVDASGDNMNYGLSGLSRPRSSQFGHRIEGLQVNPNLPGIRWAMETGPHAQRAWTYQELVLATRILVFADTQIYLRCPSESKDEQSLVYGKKKRSLVWGIDEQSIVHDTPRPGTLTVAPDNLTSRATASSEVEQAEHKRRRLYSDHLTNYSHRELSHQFDKINAITGVLNTFYPEGTHFGLPLPSFDMALLWIHEPKDQSGCLEHQADSAADMQQSNVVFPSWSWASTLNGTVRMATGASMFQGSLVVWFKKVNSHDFLTTTLEPIRPLDVSLWWEIQASAVNARLSCANALLLGLIESPATKQTKAWEGHPWGQLDALCRAKWKDYAEFWDDVFGPLCNGASIALGNVQAAGLGDGVLIARAQCALLHVDIKHWKHGSSRGGVEQKAYIVDNDGLQVGHGESHGVWPLLPHLKDGFGTFTFIALSISAQWVVSGETASGDHTGSAVRSVVNTMIAIKKDHLFHRLGLAQVAVDKWAELEAPFETICLA